MVLSAKVLTGTEATCWKFTRLLQCCYSYGTLYQ